MAALQAELAADPQHGAGKGRIGLRVNFRDFAERTNLEVEKLHLRGGTGEGADQLGLDSAELALAAKIAFDFSDQSGEEAGAREPDAFGGARLRPGRLPLGKGFLRSTTLCTQKALWATRRRHSHADTGPSISTGPLLAIITGVGEVR